MSLVVDQFAGPEGWDRAAVGLGMDPVGFEWDADACDTRRAAGYRTVRTDLASYGLPESADVEGLIGSPPCPLFSAAGSREGVNWLPHLCEVAAGVTDLTPDAPLEATLSLKPLEWALRHRPRWVALEQVPAVIVLWMAIGGRLRTEGYSVWTGVLNAANYGVPQTRQRAILMARLDAPVQPPAPTHDRDPEPSLFGDDLLPWVSMADALGLDPGLTLRAGGVKGQSPTRRCVSEVSPTAAFGHDYANWVFERPCTTVAGDERVAAPGHRDRAGGEPQFGPGSVKLTQQQALVLQSFPADYPIQGRTKHARWKQIGNAVPPLLAEHVLRAVTA